MPTFAICYTGMGVFVTIYMSTSVLRKIHSPSQLFILVPISRYIRKAE
jgi:hypothetical protein